MVDAFDRGYLKDSHDIVLNVAVLTIFVLSTLIATLVSINFAKWLSSEREIYEQPFAKLAEEKEQNSGLMKLLVLRGIDDEASLVLAAGSIGTRISNRLIFISICALFLLWQLNGAISASYWLDHFSEPVQRSVLFANACAASILIILIICSSLFKLTYGREFLSRIFTSDVNSHSAPDTVCNSDIVSLQQISGMRHAIYDNKDAANIVTRWTAKWLEEKYNYKTIGQPTRRWGTTTF